VLAADSVLLAPNFPRVVRQEIALPRWPSRLDGFTIAQLSDFHYDPYFSAHPLKAAIPMVNALHPDLVVLTGDFVSQPYFAEDFGPSAVAAAAAAEPCSKLLRQIQSPRGLWAVLGNHDVYTDAARVTRALRAEGISVLRNQSVAIEKDGARFWLSGVDDVMLGAADVPTTLASIPAGEATVMLAHEPDFADKVAHYPVDLQLSGHSHGGQVRFPFLPPLYLPNLAKKYIWGLFRIGNLMLYTNPGLGTVNIPVRLNCPPEITLFTLRRG